MNLQYEERADGLLYPILDMGQDRLQNLGKFGKARLEYLYHNKFELYNELLINGELANLMEEVDEHSYKKSELLQQKHLEKYGLSLLDFMQTVQLRTQARNWADEVVMAEIIT